MWVLERASSARTIWVALALASVLFLSRAARAQAVIPIPKAPSVAPAPQVPTLEPAADLSGLSGKPITRIAVLLEGNVWKDVDVPAIHDVKTGELLTPAVARRALAELLGTGRFARARVAASPDNGGAALVLHATPRKLIGRLQLDLHGARVDAEELLREANLVEGGEIVGADVGEASARIARDLWVHGYPAAKVELQTRMTDDPFRTFVVIDVSPGAPRLIDDRRFYLFGEPKAELSVVADAYAVRRGDLADELALDTADGSLEQVLRSKGWHRADVSHDVVWVSEAHRTFVVLRVRIDAGPRQVPRFEGNEHYDADALTAALALETETDRSPSHLADRLRAFYQRRGFLDVEVRPEMRGADTAPVQLIVFHVTEHARVRVTARRYPCLKLEAVKSLSNGGPRSGGEIGTEIDSFLEEELPGADFLVDPDPRGVSRTIGAGAGQIATGARPEPVDLRPDDTYVADTYDRAAEHVQELYRNEGFLHAEVGPVQVLRAHCDPRSPPNRCVERPIPPLPTSVCAYGPTGLPLRSPPLDPTFTCRPDPARGVVCAPSTQLIVPVKLGPRTQLWDAAFTGVRSVSESEVAEAAQLPLGEAVSATKLDAARRRVVDWYKELGYAYVDVKYTLEPSLDNTRARLRIDVTEGAQVIVRSLVVRGLRNTRESVVRRRIRLELGQPYRMSQVEKTRENIETLGVVSSVTVSLSDPYIPESGKTVYIDVVETLPRYIEVRPGFSTGEGVRGTIEYDERNVLGYAISAVLRAQLSYLPDALILDPQVATNYQQVQDRLARRLTLSATFPEVGLGPQVRAQADAIYVRDLERDFALDKISGVGSLIYRPVREITMTLGQSVEDNDVRLFQFNSTAAYLACNPNGFNAGLAALLRVPDGESLVVAERASVAWDRRDSAFNAHRGTFVFLGAELVNSFPEGSPIKPNVSQSSCGTINVDDPNVQKVLAAAPQAFSHFVRLTQTFAGYIPIFRDVSLALELRLGENVRTAPCSYVTPDPTLPAYCTYPDRLFFMGGFDSMRGWLQDTFIPQDYADTIAMAAQTGGQQGVVAFRGAPPYNRTIQETQNFAPSAPALCTNSSSNCLIPLRGGNLMINPRAELRFPVYSAIDGAVFADFGNLWVDPTYIYNHPITTSLLRADVGAGIRLQTPVGPLVFDYGINVTRRSYEDFGAFHFAIGLF
jgi:outer membrane protein insertion porin family